MSSLYRRENFYTSFLGSSWQVFATLNSFVVLRFNLHSQPAKSTTVGDAGSAANAGGGAAGDAAAGATGGSAPGAASTGAARSRGRISLLHVLKARWHGRVVEFDLFLKPSA